MQLAVELLEVRCCQQCVMLVGPLRVLARGTPQQVRGEGHSLSRPAGHLIRNELVAFDALGVS